MQSKVIFVVLIMLSFSAFHDSFFSILDNNKHTDVVHYMSDKSISSECGLVSQYPEAGGSIPFRILYRAA